jgi:hypothetical protein
VGRVEFQSDGAHCCFEGDGLRHCERCG